VRPFGALLRLVVRKSGFSLTIIYSLGLILLWRGSSRKVCTVLMAVFPFRAAA
jgi:hypothetical protein